MALVVAVVLGLLSSSSCSAAAVTMAITAVAVVATTVAVATTAVAKLKSKDNLGISGVSFLCENKIIFKVKK